MCSFLNNLFTVTGNNNTIYSENRIGNRKFHSKLPIVVFQINSISLIGSEEFRETWNEFGYYGHPAKRAIFFLRKENVCLITMLKNFRLKKTYQWP